MTASALDASSALDVDTVDVFGALVSDKLSEDLLTAGFFDNAGLDLYVVDWVHPKTRFRLIAGGRSARTTAEEIVDELSE